MDHRDDPLSDVGAIIEENLGPWYALALGLLRNEEQAQFIVQNVCSKAIATEGQSADAKVVAANIRKAIIFDAIAAIKSRGEFGVEPNKAQLPKYDRFGVLIEKPERSLLPADELAEKPEVLASVEAAMDTLPEKFRILLMLCDIEGMESAEVAPLMEMSSDTAKRDLHIARLLLSSTLSPLFGEEGK